MIIPEAKVIYDSAAGVVRCCMKGLQTMQSLDEYERTLQQAVAVARRQSPQILMLFDSSAAPVQPAEIIDRMRIIGQAVRSPDDRLAIVVGSMLVKMQADRTTSGFPNEQVFRTMAEGEAWLKS